MRFRNLLLAAVLVAGCAGQSGSSPLSLDGTWAFQVIESLGCDEMPSSFLAGGEPQLFAVSQTGAAVAAQFVDNDGALCTLDGTFHPDDFLGTLTVAGGARTVVFSAEGFARVRNGRPQVDGTLRVVSDTEDKCLGAIVVFCADIQAGDAADVNLPATLVFLAPDDGFSVDPGATVEIRYIDNDPDDVASTSLFADQDGDLSTTGDQVVIATNRPEQDGATQTVAWDTTGVPAGSYRIIGVTTDGHLTVTGEAAGRLNINAPPAGEGEPTLAVTVPGTDLRFCPGAIVNITYVDSGGGTTSLFADPDGDLATTAGQIEIAADRPTTGGTPQSVPWDTEGVPLDTYFIVARMSDLTVTAAGVAELVAPSTMTSVRQEGGDQNDQARSVASFPDGSWVVTGSINGVQVIGDEGTATFGIGDANETTLTEEFAMFVARYNADGTLAWARSSAGTNTAIGTRVETFADGTCVVVGDFGSPFLAGPAVFGSGEANETALTTEGLQDVFVARYAANGDLLWARGFGAGSDDFPGGVAPLSDGSCVVTGQFEGTMTLGAAEPGETTLTSAGDYDIFIARYAANGDLVWADRVGGTRDDAGVAIAGFPDGSFVVTGEYKGATFGAGEPGETTLPTGGAADIFIARYNADNTLAWARRDGEAGSLKADRGSGIATYADGSFAWTGWFEGTSTILGAGDPNETTFTDFGNGADMLVARYNADGSLAWARQAGATGQPTAGFEIATRSDGSVVVAGRYSGVATFSPGEANEMAVDSGGAFVFNAFVATYNADGSLVCTRTDGGSGTAVFGWGVAILPDGSIVTVGSFTVAGPATFDEGGPNETTFDPLGGTTDIFIMRLTQAGAP